MNLFVAMLVTGFLLVQTGQAAIMTFVEPVIFLHRQPQAPHFLQREIERLDRPCLKAGEADVRINAALFHQLARRQCLFNALLGDVDIPPAGKAVFEIPLRLAMAKQDELWHLCVLTLVDDFP